ncbi:nitrate reductase [Dyella sp.]|uniref:nitrate reductase n=1 Tax=Dyella sp. TaxID=1869338 RepID=UPI002ED5612D
MQSLATLEQKRRERTAFLLLAAALFPILAVVIVAGFGFIVWFWQMFVSGPPGPPG